MPARHPPVAQPLRLLAAGAAIAMVIAACGDSGSDTTTTVPAGITTTTTTASAPTTVPDTTAPATTTTLAAAEPVVTAERRAESGNRPPYDVDLTVPVLSGVTADVAAAVNGAIEAFVSEQVLGFLDFAYDEDDYRNDFPHQLFVDYRVGVLTPAELELTLTVERLEPLPFRPPFESVTFIFDLATGEQRRGLAVTGMLYEEEGTDPPYGLLLSQPQVSGLADPAVAARINDHIESIYDREAEAFRASLADFPYEEGFPRSEFEITYELTLLNEEVLSLRFYLFWFYSGAAHPTDDITTLLLDLRTGEDYTLDQLLSGDSAALAILTLTEQHLIDDIYQGDAEGLYGYVDLVEELNFGEWALTPSSLDVSYGRYEAGPGVLGSVTVSIPFEELGVLINADGPIAALAARSGAGAPSEPRVVTEERTVVGDDAPYELALDVPQVVGFPPAVQTAINERIDQHLAERSDAFVAGLADHLAELDPAEVAEVQSSVLDLEFEVTLLTDEVLSILFDELWAYQPAARPDSAITSLLFDLETGRELTLPDLLVGDSAPGGLLTLTERAVAEQYYEGDLDELRAYVDIVGDAVFGAWTLTPTTFDVSFGRDEVVAGPLGRVTVSIPYEEFGVLINPEGPLASLVPVG